MSDLKATEIASVEEVHRYIEHSYSLPEVPLELTKNLRKILDVSSEKLIKQVVIWECIALDFELIKGKVRPYYEIPKEDGTSVWGYPSYVSFNDGGFEYLKSRAATTTNMLLAARYNQVLWDAPAPYKNIRYAKSAVDFYLSFLQNVRYTSGKRSRRDEILHYFKNGFCISQQIKYRVEDFKQLVKEYLFHRGKFNPDLRVVLLEFLLDAPLFRKEDFVGTLSLLEKIGRKKSGYFASKATYYIGLRIARKCGSDTKIWYKRLGDTHVKAAEKRMNDKTRIIPLDFYNQAIDYYQKGSYHKKAQAAEKRYFELKEELTLSRIEAPISRKSQQILEQTLTDFVLNLINKDPQDILEYLMYGKGIFPTRQILEKMAENKEDAFLDFVTVLKFDKNKNLRKKTIGTTKDEKLFENYHYFAQINTNPMLYRIFLDGIKQGKITFNHLSGFFSQKTWLGTELSERNSTGDRIHYNWISLIAPSLHDYIFQIETALKSEKSFTNFVLPIDSLTLKFEGVLRDFAKLIGVATTVGKKGVLREMYIEELLAEKEISKHFSEDDMLLFQYLFVARYGINLRNNIAHCFYKSTDYSFHHMHLLICAFLKIGKFTARRTI